MGEGSHGGRSIEPVLESRPCGLEVLPGKPEECPEFLLVLCLGMTDHLSPEILGGIGIPGRVSEITEEQECIHLPAILKFPGHVPGPFCRFDGLQKGIITRVKEGDLDEGVEDAPVPKVHAVETPRRQHDLVPIDVGGANVFDDGHVPAVAARGMVNR